MHVCVCIKLGATKTPRFLSKTNEACLHMFFGIWWVPSPEFWETTQVRSPPAGFQGREKAVKITRHISQAHGQDWHVDLQFAHRHSGQISYILAEHTISLDLIAASWADRRQNERERDHTMWQGSFTNMFNQGRITKGIGVSRPILGADSLRPNPTECLEVLDPRLHCSAPSVALGQTGSWSAGSQSPGH